MNLVHCMRCDNPAGNDERGLGHFWSYCNQDNCFKEPHFCCPGNCELKGQHARQSADNTRSSILDYLPGRRPAT